ncbi:MAG: mechanosensitive ion channel family protein [Pirellulaceae bacterium]|nr:mechanosensitive ion channel family protein [Pirellulaceae bacterium]
MEMDYQKLLQDVSPLLVTYGLRAAGVLGLLLVAWLIAGWVSRILGHALQRAHFDITLTKFSSKMVRWLVLVMAILGCLSMFGIETTSFAAVLGAASLAMGLALQGTLSNFAAGMMLLVFRPFKVGDWITTANESGRVDEIELFTTSLDTGDNRRVILPNGAIFGSVIENASYHPARRVEVAVGVEYRADIDRTREVLLKAALDVPGRLDDPAPAVLLSGLGDSSVQWLVRVWCPTSDYWVVRDAATRSVKLALDRARIGIPFPTMNLHVESGASERLRISA